MLIAESRMSRIKSPDEKKRLSLTKDHRVFALEGNKSFRSAWRRKKALSNRQFRRAGTIALADSAQTDNGEAPVGPTTKPMRSLVKYGVMSLAQSISFKNGDAGSRWNYGILGKNPDALEAIIPSKKPRGEHSE
jgi:hypothetical protein